MLERAAGDAVKHLPPPKVKVGPEPPHNAGADVPLPHGAGLDTPVAIRTVVDHAALERKLEQAGARVSSGDSAPLVVLDITGLEGVKRW